MDRYLVKRQATKETDDPSVKKLKTNTTHKQKTMSDTYTATAAEESATNNRVEKVGY